MNQNFSLLAASATLAAMLGGCADHAPPPIAQIHCPSGYDVAYDAFGPLCQLRASPPPASDAAASPRHDDPPASQPASQPAPPPPKASAPTWAHDLKTAGAGAAIGAIAGNQLAKRGATAAGAGATAGMIAPGAAAEGAAVGAGEGAAAITAGEGAMGIAGDTALIGEGAELLLLGEELVELCLFICW